MVANLVLGDFGDFFGDCGDFAALNTVIWSEQELLFIGEELGETYLNVLILGWVDLASSEVVRAELLDDKGGVTMWEAGMDNGWFTGVSIV